MALGIGNHVAKIKQTYNPETKDTTFIPEVVEAEAYHEFEILGLTGDQGAPEGFTAILKLVK